MYLGADGSQLSYNLFAYCFNNPINMVDQSGNWPKWATKLSIAVAVVAVAATVAVITVATAGGWSAIACIAVGAAKGAVSGAITGGITGGLSYNSGATSAGKGFDTYRQLKNEIVLPGAGNEWRHIVEQSQIAKSGFSAQYEFGINVIKMFM